MDVICTILAIAVIVSLATLQFQAALGFGVFAVVAALITVPASQPRVSVGYAPSSHSVAAPPRSGIGVRVISATARLDANPQALDIVLAASKEFSVPPEILLTHWYLESCMSLGGDKGGAGGHYALAQIIRKQTEEPRRRHRFIANERDLRAVCEHCGYDCNAIQGSSTGALGPMQFQPSTWVLGAVDADGDGKACPLSLADAMFTAAKKLRGGFNQTGYWTGAMLAYAGVNCKENHAYVRRAQPIRERFRRYLEDRNLLASN